MVRSGKYTLVGWFAAKIEFGPISARGSRSGPARRRRAADCTGPSAATRGMPIGWPPLIVVGRSSEKRPDPAVPVVEGLAAPEVRGRGPDAHHQGVVGPTAHRGVESVGEAEVAERRGSAGAAVAGRRVGARVVAAERRVGQSSPFDRIGVSSGSCAGNVSARFVPATGHEHEDAEPHEQHGEQDPEGDEQVLAGRSERASRRPSAGSSSSSARYASTRLDECGERPDDAATARSPSRSRARQRATRARGSRRATPAAHAGSGCRARAGAGARGTPGPAEPGARRGRSGVRSGRRTRAGSRSR